MLLTNRRATQIELRDQDQAIVTRSQVKFDVQGGVRAYSGMVQRDATLLPTAMFSDGTDWASFRQRVGDIPLQPEDLQPDIKTPEGGLTPHDIFVRDPGSETPVSRIDFGASIGGDIDPYEFLARGLFIDGSGMVLDEELTFGDTYGGKQVYRTFYDPSSTEGAKRQNSLDRIRRAYIRPLWVDLVGELYLIDSLALNH